MRFSCYGEIDEIVCKTFWVNSSESCWVPNGWNYGLAFRNIATNIFGVTYVDSNYFITFFKLDAITTP